MATHTQTQVKELQDSALEHLWIYLREPGHGVKVGPAQGVGHVNTVALNEYFGLPLFRHVAGLS